MLKAGCSLAVFCGALLFSLNLSGATPFIRGDANNDGQVDIVDVCRIFDHLFGQGSIPCLDAGDANADARLDLSDGVYLTNYLFASGPSPAAPFPGCGRNPFVGLGCGTPPSPCGVIIPHPIDLAQKLRITNGVTTGTAPQTLDVELTSTVPLGGFSLAVCVDPLHVSVTDAGVIGTSITPDLAISQLLRGGFNMGVVMSVVGATTIPAGTGAVVANFELTPVTGTAMTSAVSFCQLGNPAVDNVLLKNCTGVIPMLTDGQFTTMAPVSCATLKTQTLTALFSVLSGATGITPGSPCKGKVIMSTMKALAAVISDSYATALSHIQTALSLLLGSPGNGCTLSAAEKAALIPALQTAEGLTQDLINNNCP